MTLGPLGEHLHRTRLTAVIDFPFHLKYILSRVHLMASEHAIRPLPVAGATRKKIPIRVFGPRLDP
jgi:hypothetical protein